MSMRPADVCQALLEAQEASEGRRRRRKRNTTADSLGFAMKTELLRRAIAADPDPDDFEPWLVERCLEAGPGSGGRRAMAASILEEWRLAAAAGSFRAWLDEGAPSDDRSAPGEGGRRRVPAGHDADTGDPEDDGGAGGDSGDGGDGGGDGRGDGQGDGRGEGRRSSPTSAFAIPLFPFVIASLALTGCSRDADEVFAEIDRPAYSPHVVAALSGSADERRLIYNAPPSLERQPGDTAGPATLPPGSAAPEEEPEPTPELDEEAEEPRDSGG